MRRSIAVLTLIVFTCFSAGCDDDSSSTTTTTTTTSSNAQGSAPPGAAPGKVTGQTGAPSAAAAGEAPPAPSAVPPEEFQRMVDTEVPVYTAKMDAIRAKIETVSGAEQKTLQKKYDQLNGTFQDVTRKFREVDTNSGFWGQVSGFMKMEWEGLKKDIDSTLGLEPGAPLPGTEATAPAETTTPEADSTDGTSTHDAATDSTETEGSAPADSTESTETTESDAAAGDDQGAATPQP